MEIHCYMSLIIVIFAYDFLGKHSLQFWIG